LKEALRHWRFFLCANGDANNGKIFLVGDAAASHRTATGAKV